MDLINLNDVVRFGAALVFVLALMGGLALLMRRFGHGHPLTDPRKRRLKIVEILTLAPRHRAMLIRRDDREHLIILGPNGETLVEHGIESPQDEPITVTDQTKSVRTV